MLYVVGTPIGNLKDITLRAVEILLDVPVILCEDTRKTYQLLLKYQKPGKNLPRLISFYEENENQRIPEVISLLKSGTEIALVSNSGTPTISDPGFKLIRQCWDEGIKVIPIPGPSSCIAALSCSGLPTDKFLFLGFLPKKEGEKKRLLENIKKSFDFILPTVIFFESPFRLIKTLKLIKDVFGDITLVICREITKIYEETKREKVSFFLEEYAKNEPKGELVILFNPKV